MIDAIRSQAPPADLSAVRPQTPPAQLASPEDAPAPDIESPTATAMDVLESDQEADQASQSVQISLLNTGLEIAKAMAGQVVGMVNAPRAYEAAAAQPSQKTVDTVA